MNKAETLLGLVQSVDEGYSSVKFCPDSDAWIDTLKQVIADSSDYDKMNFDTGHDNHCTLMYAPGTGAPDEGTISDLVGSKLHLKNPRYEIFGERADYLVLAFDSDLLHSFNYRLRASGEMPSAISAEYSPHITLAKDVENLDVSTLPELPTDLYLNITGVTAEEIEND